MNLGNFKTYVKQDFKRTDKDTELVQAYNDMVMWVCVLMPHSGFKWQSYVNTIAGTEDYGLPYDLIHLIHTIKLIKGTGASDGGYNLDYIDKDTYDTIEPNPNIGSPNTGIPSKYTVFNRCILLTPVPDSADYIMEIDWTKRPTDLSLDIETTSLGDEWEEVLKWGVLERLNAGIGLFEESMFWGSKYHSMGPNGDDIPVGMCRRLIDAEKDREGHAIGQVKFNNL